MGDRSSVGMSLIPTSAVQVQVDSSPSTKESCRQESRELENQSDSQRMHVSQMPYSSMSTINQESELPSIPIQGLEKEQQLYLDLAQSSFKNSEGEVGSDHTHAKQTVSGVSSSNAANVQALQNRQVPLQQDTQSKVAMQPANVMSMPVYEKRKSSEELDKMYGESLFYVMENSTLQKNPSLLQFSMSKEQKSDALLYMAYGKDKPVRQTTAQQYNSQLSTALGPSSLGAVQVGQGNGAPPETLGAKSSGQPSKIVLSENMSVVPTMTAELDPSFPVSLAFIQDIASFVST
ncbi:hypothetical protein L1049_014671 [Liquidambar formosana]|uniref:Uncharacterized protein n=1 Tax=Liquidambar formosana TaxID=63359 RepID=A0AAP0RWU0_LIQFO